MKNLYLVSAFLLATTVCFAQPTVRELSPSEADSIKKSKSVFPRVEEQLPEYPGGSSAFGNYISRNLKYPDVARMIGIDGRLIMTFIIERDGKISNVTPLNCIGAGCEAEAVRVLQESKAWRPGVQDGRPVRVQFSVPISFSAAKGKVSMKELRASQYGFVFNIKGQLYTLDEAQGVIGKSFQSAQVKIAEPFYNDGDNPKYHMPDKKEVYVLKMKD